MVPLSNAFGTVPCWTVTVTLSPAAAGGWGQWLRTGAPGPPTQGEIGLFSMTLGESLGYVLQGLWWLRQGKAPGFRGHHFLQAALATAYTQRGPEAGHSLETQGSSHVRACVHTHNCGLDSLWLPGTTAV